ncbi:acyl-CoA dehydrogenase family protein [Phytohabitans sp. ZYX-F-186]|uniref:Acyl-CoA dehydrogenase family protein n=1 Tax=Phytohabitans maris TaxID=3071409 RepID=A0ABU0ZQQ9_9ACTN|nr:acyl-CoA dehydrogenase family protein [Phytohabitans sp. ZYX-F-186]MDQ7909360.1 acyl-CoA dehydrogenase family protein [Phytohabitans sp. ZYX-F-186]
MAEFEFTEDLDDLRAMVRKFCAEFSPEPVVRATMETEAGYDAELWRRLGTELGVLGLAVDEEFGGAGAGLVAQAVAVEEMGAALVCGPVVGTLALAIPLLSAAGDDATRRAYLPDLVDGGRTATVAAPLTGGTFDAAAVTVAAKAEGDGWKAEGDGWVVSGRVEFVPDGAAADLLLVAARTDHGVALFAVDAAADGVRREPLATLDLTRRQAVVEFSGAPARLIAGEKRALAALAHAARVGAVLLAAEQVGGGRAMLDRTVEHVTGRYQFGRPLGSFQAVKHRCADMLVAVEQARSAAYHGAWALQDGTDDPQLAASIAKAVASEAYTRVAAAAIQLHGGIGFTWEHPAHLYFKRATADSLTLGTVAQHVDLVAGIALDRD